MKIFICSTNSKESQSNIFSDILAYLNSSNNSVFHYVHDSTSGKSKYTFDELIGEINKAEVFIAEMSHPSQTLGFQLAHALHLSKPALYLYSPGQKTKPKGLIGNIPSRSLKIKCYTQNNFQSVLDDFIKFAQKQMLSTRTSFMSTKEIDDYVSNESKRLGISKGEVLRTMLNKVIAS